MEKQKINHGHVIEGRREITQTHNMIYISIQKKKTLCYLRQELVSILVCAT